VTTVADTGAIIALADVTDRRHSAMVERFDADGGDWILPWAILPEVDYLLGAHIGRRAQDTFLRDFADGSLNIDWGHPQDLVRVGALQTKYASLHLGLVDAVVIAIAERVVAKTIATLDVRHFGAVAIRGRPRIFPRDG
jgi:uncharacterized protein